MNYSDEKVDSEDVRLDVDRKTSIVSESGEVVNASGHRDQLKRHFGLWSICGLALTIDNAWVALAGSIAVSISMLPLHLIIRRSLTGYVRDRQWRTTRRALRTAGRMRLLRFHRRLYCRSE